jgi:CubicO group peptidase (beta-lactamase class C family)
MSITPVTLILTSLFVTSSCFNAETLSSVIETSFRCRTKTNPGLAVSVVKGGKTLLSHGYGFTDAHGNTRVTSNTRFNVASLTKGLTATLMLKVMDDTGR